MRVLAAPERVGVVTELDERRGLGVVVADDGRALGFHCTSIADGSRSIPVGVAVRFTVVPGALGAWEASAIRRA